MSIVAPFLKNTITAIYSVQTDAYNDVTTTEVYSNVPCRWEEVIEETFESEGIKREFSIRCWILPEYNVLADYQIEYGGIIYELVGYEKYSNVFGKHDHTVLYLGVMR